MNGNQPTLAHISRKDGRGLIGSLLLSVPVTLLIGALMLFLAAFIVYRREDPAASVTLGGYAALGATAFLAGLSSGRLYRRRGWLLGLLSGGVLLATLAALSAALGTEALLPVGQSALLHLSVPLVSLLGGTVGGARRVKSKKRRKIGR